MIELRSVAKSYGTVIAVKDKSLTVRSGSTLCVLGRNGSGKSTLLKIAGLITEPDSGSVILDGVDLTGLTASSREKIRNEHFGYSFQESLLIPYLTTIENVLLGFPASVSKKSPDAEARRMLSEMGLSERLTHTPSKLSGGEKKKIDLARALLRNPKILVADEPLSMIDPDSAEIVIGILQDFKERGGSAIYSAIDPAHAMWADSTFRLES